MTNKHNTIIKNKIIAYYENNKRNLPWRTEKDNDQDPYFTLVSEIMLQQTQVNTVLDYYKRFLQKWPNIDSLSKASTEEVLVLWSGLGYYNRAKNLLKSAKIIKTNFNGIIPNKLEELLSLPGIGEYTACAIISFAYGKFSLVLDTNVKRFIKRIYGLNNKNKLEKEEINKYGLKLFPRDNSGKFAQALMDFSSDICTKIKPSCSSCFLNTYCKYDKENEEPSKKLLIKKKFSIVFFYLYKKKFFFLKKRSLTSLLDGMYEVPGTAWTEEKWPNINMDLKKKNFLPGIIKYKFSHISLETKVYKVEIRKKEVIKEKGVWVSIEKLHDIPVSGLTKKIIKHSI